MSDREKAEKLWERIFNSDIEEAFLERNNLTKNFEDMGTEEEREEIISCLEDKTLSDIIDDYLQYNGHGLYASDLKYLLCDMLEITLEELKELD